MKVREEERLKNQKGQLTMSHPTRKLGQIFKEAVVFCYRRPLGVLMRTILTVRQEWNPDPMNGEMNQE